MQALWDDLRARRAVGAKTARMPGHYWAWMNRFDWPGRALAYDKHNAEVERKAIDKVRRERAELRERQRLELQDSQYQTAQLAEEGVALAIALTTALARKMTRGLAESQKAVAAGAPDTFDYPKPQEIDQIAYRFRALDSAMEAIYAQLYMSLQPLQRDDGSPHGRSCGKAVVDQDHDAPTHAERRSTVAIGVLAALQLVKGAPGNHINRPVRNIPRRAGTFVEHDHAARCNRPHRDLFVAGQAKFAHDQDIEGSGKPLCHFKPNGNSSARQCKHDHVGTPGVGREFLRHRSGSRCPRIDSLEL
jgi:hypothetical protein